MKYISIILGVFFLFLSCVSFGSKVAISPSGYLYHDMGEVRALFDLASMKGNRFAIDYLNKYGYFYELDPTGKKHVSINEDNFAKGDCKNSAIGRFYLKLIDLESNEVLANIEDGGKRFSFSPDGNRIAYISDYPGRWPEGCKAPEGYEEGVWIYNLDSKSKTRIDTGFKWNMNINWSPHDRHIYVTNNVTTFKYNPETTDGTVIKNNCLYYSQGGEFCISAPFEGSSGIYRMPENEREKSLEEDIGKKDYPGIFFTSMLYKNNAAIFSISNTERVIFSFNQKRILGGFEGHVIGSDPEEKRLAIHPYESTNGNKIDWNTVKIIDLDSLTK